MMAGNPIWTGKPVFAREKLMLLVERIIIASFVNCQWTGVSIHLFNRSA